MEVFSLPPLLPACFFAVTSLCRAPIPLFLVKWDKESDPKPCRHLQCGLGESPAVLDVLCRVLSAGAPQPWVLCRGAQTPQRSRSALSAGQHAQNPLCKDPVLGGLAPRVSAQPHSAVMVASCPLLHGQISRCRQGQEVSGVELLPSLQHLPLEAPSQSFTSLAPVCRWRKVLLSKKTLTSSAGL